MSDILYSKLRLEVPSVLNGENATITSEHGNSRVVQMSSPITDIMLAGMEKYRVQAGLTDENVSFGYGEIKKVEAKFRDILKKLPYNQINYLAVVYNNEIHIFNYVSNVGAIHYKWNGSDWVSVSTPPYNIEGSGAAVVLNNEIHILGGGSSADRNKHYKWDGSSWTSVSTLPYSIYNHSAVVYNNEIHILGGGDNNNNTNLSKRHYKWNGSSWVSVSTLPYEFVFSSAVVYNNEIHILGSYYRTGSYPNLTYPHRLKHYKWNGSSWVNVSTLPYDFCGSDAVVYNNEIHILGSYYESDNTVIHAKKHYKWNGSSWSSVSTLPYNFYYSSAVVWNSHVSDEIALIGGRPDGKYDAQWDGTSWTVGED